MDLTSYIIGFVTFANNYIIPFLSGLAFLFFVFFAFRYFIMQGGSEEGREKAKALALYGVLAFVFILVFWGIVNALTGSLGVAKYGANNVPCSDYQQLGGRGCTPDPNNTVVTTAPIVPAIPDIGDSVGDLGAVVPDDALPVIGAPTSTETNLNPDDLVTPSIDINSAPSVADSPIAQQAAVTKVTQISNDFLAQANTLYSDSANTVITDSVAALNNPNASVQEQAIAAARLYNYDVNNNPDDARIFSDSAWVTYINTLNAKAKQGGGVGITAVDARNNASAPTQALQASQANTSDTIYNALLFANQRFWRTSATEARMSQAEVDTITSIHPPSARLAAFDQLVAEKPALSTNTVTVTDQIRQQLLADINAERFLNGQPPLTPEQQINTTVVGISSAGS